MQSYQVFADVGGHKSVCIYGGVGKGDQIRYCTFFLVFIFFDSYSYLLFRELKQGAEVVVATPGRLIDLMHDNLLSLQGKLLRPL